MKQEETLEEAIKREYETRKFNSDFPFDPQSFKLGAKWQQEQLKDVYLDAYVDGSRAQAKLMYSEEDMKKCWQEATEDMRKQFSTSYAGMTFEKWFEKIKNK